MKRIQGDLQRIGIRQAGSGDCDAIRAFLDGLSPQTRYLRFFTGAPGASTATVRRLAGDGENIDAVVATEAGAIIGHAIAADLTDATGAHITEIGVTVTDARQGQGVGSALTRELAARAKARGATAMAMDVLAENRRTLSMIADHWPAARYDRSGPCITIQARLPEREDATLPEREDATLPEREDATLPEREDATLPEREDATLPEREDATLPEYRA